ncbi:MAG: GDP-mannose 4,6-dehydratase, partial [Candidatus Pacearchaeota archaeon]
VVAAFAKKIAEIEKNKLEPVITVGNLNSMRDFTDVRDMVKAYSLAIEMGKPGDVYNLGSGNAYKISDILNKLISFSTKKIKIKVDKKLLRPIDVSELRCDFGKFNRLTGWKPEIPLKKSLKDTLDYWRNII